MLSYVRRHHIGLLALFIALSGTTYAAATGSIDSREIRNGTIVGKDVRDNRLGGADLKNGSVRSRDVADNSLIGADVLDASLNGGDLANGSVDGADLRDGNVADADLGVNSVSSDEVRNGSLGSQDISGSALASNARVRFDTFAVGAGASGEDAVGCASGERALGGGVSFAADDAGDRITYSEPRAGGATPGSQGATANTWAAGIHNGGAAERTATVWAICASR